MTDNITRRIVDGEPVVAVSRLVNLRKVCGEKDARIASLEAERDRAMEHAVAMAAAEVLKNERIAELEAECERLRAVVLWYAEYGGTTAIENDYGKRARAALKGRG